jgi:Uma2 family endonuclease
MTRTLALTELVDAPPADDPYRYGSRMALRAQPDGTLRSEMLPLTLWDVLHPQEGDHITQSIRHQKEVRYLTDVIEKRAKQYERALVLSDTAIYWDTPGLSHHSPDVAVIFGLRRILEQYTSFSVSYEAARPELIIEVVSPHARSNDTFTKLLEYRAAGVPTYVIIDREKEDDWPTIRAYRLEEGLYKPLALDDRDCLLLPMLNLRLCANQNRITLYDAVTGAEMGDYDAISDALEAEARARQKAEDEARLAKEKAEEAEAARLRAEGEQRKAEDERRKAEDEKHKAEGEQRKAEDEKRKAEERARLADEQKRHAEEEAQLARSAADGAAKARQAAEEQARLQADARADLERRLRELEAKLAEKQDG